MKYGLVITTPPASSPVLVTGPGSFRAFRRIFGNDEEDMHLQVLLDTATQYVEKQTAHTLVPTQYTVTYDHFPHESPYYTIRLPRWPVISVDEVKYYDTDDNLVSYPDFRVTSSGAPVEVYPKDGAYWPMSRWFRRSAVTVKFTAGYSDITRIPLIAKQAVMYMASHLFEFREGFAAVPEITEVPKTLKAFIKMSKPMGFVA